MKMLIRLLLILPLFAILNGGARAQFAAQQTWCSGSCVGGVPNAITLAIPNIVTSSDLVGVPLRFVPTAANTTDTTITVGSTPPLHIKKAGFSAPVFLTGGELQAGSPVAVMSDGAEYILYAGGFINGGPALSAPVSYYVSNTGSDSNTCLGILTPCLTIQHALSLVNKLNLNGYTVTINLADGVYAPITLPLINGSGTVIINGDSLNPSNTIIFNTSTGSAINAANTIGYIIQNVLLQTTAPSSGDPAVGVWTQGANITLVNVYYGSCNGGFVFAVGGTVSLFGNIVISGSSPGNVLAPGAAFLVLSGGAINVSPALVSITISVPVSIQYFIYAASNGSTSILYSSLTGASNMTGTKYFATLNGVISTGTGAPSYYPGSTGGSAIRGGQYF